MERLSQSPTDPGFVQNPYPAYAEARASGDLVFWEDYGLVAALSHRAVSTLLKDRRFGREPLAPPTFPPHLADFAALERHSMLELEPPRHTRLRSLVLRAFTSRRIADLGPGIAALADRLLDAAPAPPFDLIDHVARPLPAIIIARLLGVPETDWRALLEWSNAMVRMYQAARTRADEDACAVASRAFTAYLREQIAHRRKAPTADLLSRLIAAEEDGERLTTDELISTCILLLNAGHEATVHATGNGVKTLIAADHRAITPEVVEEVLRIDPPLHVFNRFCYQDLELFGHGFRRGDEVMCVLGSAGRDPAVFHDPDRFDPTRFAAANRASQNSAFGGGLHFCVGAPLARLELLHSLTAIFARHPGLTLAATPVYADSYHFHGLTELLVTS